MVSNEGGAGLEIRETEQPKINNEGGGDMAAVMWERFLPKMVLRVLLVESDVSTRQIIAALLRKCSYRGLCVSFLASISLKDSIFSVLQCLMIRC